MEIKSICNNVLLFACEFSQRKDNIVLLQQQKNEENRSGLVVLMKVMDFLSDFSKGLEGQIFDDNQLEDKLKFFKVIVEWFKAFYDLKNLNQGI